MPTERLPKSAIQRLIEAEASRQGMDPGLLVALARQESGLNPQARSPVGAIGLMQLMPGTARQLGVDPYDLEDNIRGGVRYLKQQQDRFGGDTRLALAAYNAGPGAVAKYGGVPPYKETQQYVQRILGASGLQRQAPRRSAADWAARLFPEAGTATPPPAPALQPVNWAQRLFPEIAFNAGTFNAGTATATPSPAERLSAADWAARLFPEAPAPSNAGTATPSPAAAPALAPAPVTAGDWAPRLFGPEAAG